MILVAQDMVEINEAAKAINKLAGDKHYAQIDLNIILVNIQADKWHVQQMFNKSLESQFIGRLNILKTNVVKDHLDRLPKATNSRQKKYFMQSLIQT